MFSNKITTNYEPKAAIVVFQRSSNDPIENHSSSTEYVIEHADVVQTDDHFVLGATTPFNTKQLDDLAAFLNKRETKRLQPFVFEGLIPQNIYYTAQQQQHTTIVFSLEAPTRHLYFSESLNIPSGEVLLPNLLFIKGLNGLRVLAYTDHKLTEKTTLYQAPFHNTTSAGICMGSAKIKPTKKTWESLVQAIDNAYFNSIFTHLNGGSPLKEGYNLNTIYSKCIAEKTPFPLESLKPLKINFLDLIK